MRNWLAIGIAGTFGVLARHTVQQHVPRFGGLPWGTFLVNLTGALLIGFLAAFVIYFFVNWKILSFLWRIG